MPKHWVIIIALTYTIALQWVLTFVYFLLFQIARESDVVDGIHLFDYDIKWQRNSFVICINHS